MLAQRRRLEELPLPLKLSSEDAFSLIQGDQYGKVKNEKVSKYYTWADTMVSTSISDKNRKEIPLSTYQNAARFAKALDEVSERVGQKVPIESWIHLNTTTYHRYGLAVDFKGTKDFLHGPVYQAVRRTPEIYGIGLSDGRVLGFVGLHVDQGKSTNPNLNHYKPGYQKQFVDNGNHPSTGQDPKWLPLE